MRNRPILAGFRAMQLGNMRVQFGNMHMQFGSVHVQVESVQMWFCGPRVQLGGVRMSSDGVRLKLGTRGWWVSSDSMQAWRVNDSTRTVNGPMWSVTLRVVSYIG